MKTPVALIILCGISIPSFADNDATMNTGNELIRYCNDANVNDPDSNNLGFQICMAYIRGIVDGVELGSGLVRYKNQINIPFPLKHGKDGVPYCLPGNITWGQQARVVTKYMDDHPADLNNPDWSMVYMAFKSAWPCPK